MGDPVVRPMYKACNNPKFMTKTRQPCLQIVKTLLYYTDWLDMAVIAKQNVVKVIQLY